MDWNMLLEGVEGPVLIGLFAALAVIIQGGVAVVRAQKSSALTQQVQLEAATICRIVDIIEKRISVDSNELVHWFLEVTHHPESSPEIVVLARQRARLTASPTPASKEIFHFEVKPHSISFRIGSWIKKSHANLLEEREFGVHDRTGIENSIDWFMKEIGKSGAYYGFANWQDMP